MADKPDTSKTVEAQKSSSVASASLPADVQASVDYVLAHCQHFGPRDQHNAFHFQLASKGWSFGVKVDADSKRHPWACDWLQLPHVERAKQHALFNPNIIEG